LSELARSAQSAPAAEVALRSKCPVANALDLLGDRWTLLVIRDLFLGKTRFSDFLASPERIPTNILADRLKRLDAAGLVEAVPYSEHPPRSAYRLTERGQALSPVIDALAVWGLSQFPGTRRADRRAAPTRPSS
jgi:DNA-binding HxlR family transcriptional regulator